MSSKTTRCNLLFQAINLRHLSYKEVISHEHMRYNFFMVHDNDPLKNRKLYTVKKDECFIIYEIMI